MELEPTQPKSEKTKITFENWSEAQELRKTVSPGLGRIARMALKIAIVTAPFRDVDLDEPVSIEVPTDKLTDIADSIDKRRKELGQLEPNQTTLKGQLREQELETLRKPITIADSDGNRTPYVGIGTYQRQMDVAAQHEQIKDIANQRRPDNLS